MKKSLLIPFTISCAFIANSYSETTTHSSFSKVFQTSSANLIGIETDADLLPFVQNLTNTIWYGPLDENGKLTGKIVTVHFDDQFNRLFEEGYRGNRKHSYGYDGATGNITSEFKFEKSECVIKKFENSIFIFPKFDHFSTNGIFAQSVRISADYGTLNFTYKLPIFQIEEQQDGTLKLKRPYFYKKKGEEKHGYEYFTQLKLNHEDVPKIEEDPIISTSYTGFSDFELYKYDYVLTETKWLGPYEWDKIENKLKLKEKAVSVEFKPGSKLSFKDNYRGNPKYFYGYDGIAGMSGDDYKTDLDYVIKKIQDTNNEDVIVILPSHTVITNTPNFKYEEINYTLNHAIFIINNFKSNGMNYLERGYFVKNEQTNTLDMNFEYYFSENTNIEELMLIEK